MVWLRGCGARLFAVAALALALGGCFYQQSRIVALHGDLQAAYQRCDRERQAGRIRSHRAAVECAMPAVRDAYKEAAYPYEDLIYVEVQARRIGASSVDAGAVTEAQYDHDVAALDTRIAAEEQRRAALTNRGETPTPAPAEALVAGLPSFATSSTAELPEPGACLPLGAIKRCQ